MNCTLGSHAPKGVYYVPVSYQVLIHPPSVLFFQIKWN